MRISQRSILSKTIPRRNLGNIVQISNIASSSAVLNVGDQATFVATSLSLSGERLLDYGDVSLYETSVSSSNQIPGGSNITKGQYQVIGPVNDYQRTDGKNSKQLFFIRNKGVSSSGSFSGRVGASSDDAVDGTAASYYSETSLQIKLGRETVFGGDQLFTDGFRFTSVTIPNAATINTAVINFLCKATLNNAGLSIKYYCEAANNGLTFSSTSIPSSRTKTTAFGGPQTTFPTVATTFDSPDISAAVQEVVNRAGWASGNAMNIIVADSGSGANNSINVDAYDDVPASAALLTVTYTTITGGNKTILIRSQGRAIINRDNLS